MFVSALDLCGFSDGYCDVVLLKEVSMTEASEGEGTYKAEVSMT